jgi:hypothetical protein
MAMAVAVSDDDAYIRVVDVGPYIRRPMVTGTRKEGATMGMPLDRQAYIRLSCCRLAVCGRPQIMILCSASLRRNPPSTTGGGFTGDAGFLTG